MMKALKVATILLPAFLLASPTAAWCCGRRAKKFWAPQTLQVKRGIRGFLQRHLPTVIKQKGRWDGDKAKMRAVYVYDKARGELTLRAVRLTRTSSAGMKKKTTKTSYVVPKRDRVSSSRFKEAIRRLERAEADKEPASSIRHHRRGILGMAKKIDWVVQRSESPVQRELTIRAGFSDTTITGPGLLPLIRKLIAPE